MSGIRHGLRITTGKLLTPEAAAVKMRVIFEPSFKHGFEDLERSHKYADDLLCGLLDELGYRKAVNVFRKAEKWYA